MKMFLLLIVVTMAGCASYESQKWTPDGLNYTLSRDRNTGELVDYVGLTWNLKPGK